MTDMKNTLDAAKWTVEPCPNHTKGWIRDSRGNRLTRLGNRNAFVKLIKMHNQEIELLEKTIISEIETKPATTEDDCRREFEDWYRSQMAYIGVFPPIAWHAWQAAWKRRGDV